MPRTLIVLSDGTGNSSAKLFRTNVWRLYEALDLTAGDQLALYDDGVGTSSFKPLAILGGAFGFGLKRNVLGLYAFLCEQYEPGDRIFAFGFSRGAFTIRVLVDLVQDQGLLSKSVPAGERHRLAAWAYRDYRRSYRQSGRHIELLRSVRDGVLRLWQWHRRARRRDGDEDRSFLPAGGFTFVGVWDMVSAYGVPIAEIADGLDRWVWPLHIPTRTLPPIVGRACHALALDDERQSFHPLLWDEQHEPQNARHVHDERLSQVWFAGMHSNVGGGYPDDALSYVPFRWLVGEAQRAGLRLVEAQAARWTGLATPVGRMYDSRQGVGVYYRYHPRHVRRLTDGQFRRHPWKLRVWRARRVPHAGSGPDAGRDTRATMPGVRVRRPKIHHSVFDRMARLPGYAPLVLPARYAVVGPTGTIDEGPGRPFERPARIRARRLREQEAVWDLVWSRRLLYTLTVMATAAVLLRPAGLGPDPDRFPNTGLFLSSFVTMVGSFAPDILAPVVEYFARYPLELIAGVVAIGGLILASTTVQARIGQRMQEVWAGARAEVVRPAAAPARLGHVPRAVRSSRVYIWATAALNHFVWPTAIGIAVWLILIALLNRGIFETLSGGGRFCEPTSASVLTLNTPTKRTMTPDGFCQPSGLLIERGAQYRVTVTMPGPSGTWIDRDVAVPEPAGVAAPSSRLTFGQRLAYLAAYPFRRVWRLGWFVPIARVGAGGADHYSLGASEVLFTARKSGELFLFVNDAVLPVTLVDGLSIGFDAYYRNNRGGIATLTITKVAERGAPRLECGAGLLCE